MVMAMVMVLVMVLVLVMVMVITVFSTSWTQQRIRGEYPRSRHDHGAAMLGHSMYIFGGSKGFTTLDDLHRVDTGTRI